MSGTAYKALGFLVWKGGVWYMRRRWGVAKHAGTGALAAAGVAALATAVVIAQRRGGSGA